MVKGLDVSNHQGIIDWSAVKASGYDFAFMKATQGVHFEDPYFVRNWNECARVGMYRGAYHYFEPYNNPDARKEADFFYNTVTKQGSFRTGDMLVLDAEVNSTPVGDYGEWSLYWMQIIQSYAGFNPLLYSNRDQIRRLHLTNAELSAYGLWLAQWLVNPNSASLVTMPDAPLPWQFLAFWQYTDKGRVPGVSGNCDLDLFNGDISRLPLYGYQSSVDPVVDVEALKKEVSILEESIANMGAELQEMKKSTEEMKALLGGA